MCILSYGINLLLLLYTWIIRKRFNLPTLFMGFQRDARMAWRNRAARYGSLMVLSIALLMPMSFPAYWQYDTEMPIASLQTGTTDDGHPWIGASDPSLEIVEYTDYLCFQCRKMHGYLRKLVARYPDKIRLIHRHFPMDHTINPLVKDPFHIGAGRMALLALYAAEEGKFWPMNDALFEYGVRKGELNLRDLSAKTGVSVSGMRKALSPRRDLEMALAKDIWAGMKLDITGTPAFVIDGVVHLAVIPPDILNHVLRP
jgi:protein-disulfide isomerase